MNKLVRTSRGTEADIRLNARRGVTKFAVSIVAWTLSMTLGFFTTASAHAGPANASLDATLASLQARSPLPGFCVAIVDASGVRYAEGFGYADVAAKRPYSANTIQPVASVSKTLIGVALMQAIEDDLVGLDNDVRDVLPFRVANPGFPK